VIKPFPKLQLSNGRELQFWSAVPVFGPNESFIALIHSKDVSLFREMQNHVLYCATSDGKHRVPMTMRGHENEDEIQQTYGKSSFETGTMIVWRCDWPAERKSDQCHDIVVSEDGSDKPLATLSACQDPSLHSEEYNLVACRTNVWTSKGYLSESGVLQLPQWIEYMLMHGVDQIFFYTLSNTSAAYKQAIRPYVNRGLAQEIRLESSTEPFQTDPYGHPTQHLQVNDCIYRAKHRARWLSPGIDVDEYLRPGSIEQSAAGSYDFPSMFSELALREEKAYPDAGRVCCLAFTGIVFRHPQDPLSELQLESGFRGTKQEEAADWISGGEYPKYVLHPELVYASFVHWPTSWEPGVRMVTLNDTDLVFHHYRTTDAKRTPDPDHTLVAQAPEIRERMEKSFNMPWPDLAAQLAASPNADPALPPPYHRNAAQEIQGYLDAR